MANLSGGPRTEQGKKISSQNAFKVGLYSCTLFDHESANDLEDMQKSLMQEWGIETTQGALLARDYAYCDLKTARLLRAQLALIESQMHMQDTKREFAKQAGISPIEQDAIPNWYFTEDDERKDEAFILANAINEAIELKNTFTLDLTLGARTNFPNLWRVVMGPHAINPKQTMGERLLARFGKNKPELNLQEFVDHHKTHSRFELLWGYNARRYSAILEGLRAKYMLEVFSRADWAKVDSAQHKRRIEILQAVHAIKRSQTVYVDACVSDASLTATDPVALTQSQGSSSAQ